MTIYPNAKINIGLHVGPRRADGYHDLETVFWPVPWCDSIEIEPAPDGETSLEVCGRAVDCAMEDNLVWRAWRLMHERYGVPAQKIRLHKVIPHQAGLGGGSSDAAFVLCALYRQYVDGYDEESLAALAATLGADCPFFVYNRPMKAHGRGDVFEPLGDVTLPFDEYNSLIAIVKPRESVSTAKAFAELDARPGERVALPWVNDFQQPVAEQCPAVAAAIAGLDDLGSVFTSLSGSGSAVYGIFPNDGEDGVDSLRHSLECRFVDADVFVAHFPSRA